MKFAPLPPQDVLLATFRYDAASGEITRVSDGKSVGSRTAEGYRHVYVAGRTYQAHRVIWKMVYGVDPYIIDHADRDRANNRLSNLREASRSENGANSRVYRSNRSGFKGVFWDNFAKKWRADTNFNGKKVFLGRFNTKEEAAAAYEEKVRELFWEFARVA